MRATLFHNPTAGGGKFTRRELITAVRVGGFSPRYVSTKGRRFKKMLKERGDKFNVIINAEKNMRYAQVQMMLHECAEARVMNLNFATKKQSEQARRKSGSVAS